MPLTPQDVQSKEFATTRFKPGYDEEEVDAFLDEVEAELNRLLTENADLRNRLNQLQTTAAAPVTAAAVPVAEPVVEPVVEPAVVAPAPVAAVAAVPVVAAEPPDQAALRTLQMAQRTADSAIAEAKAEADKMVGDARGRAADLEREAQTRHTTVMGQLESQRVALEARVEDLRAFEREYRTRLKAYLETQLRDLDGRAPADTASSAPSTTSAPVAAAAPAVPSVTPQGVPGLATPAPVGNPYAPVGGGNPYAPRPADGNPYASQPSGQAGQSGFETDDEGPEPAGS
jgi:DivIVA domain-containing protein